jgi:hypothetical protein
VSTECHDEWIASLNLSKLKLYKGYCGEVLGFKKENDMNSSAFKTNQHILNIYNKDRLTGVGVSVSDY